MVVFGMEAAAYFIAVHKSFFGGILPSVTINLALNN
jgi:hypothetical protein